MDKPIVRIKEIAEANGLTLTEMERIIGASKGVLTRAASKGTNIQLRWLEAIAEHYPEWSAEWIITGRDKNADSAKLAEAAADLPEKLRPMASLTKGVPYYDEDFLLGFSELIPPTSEAPRCLLAVPGFERATLWCRVSGNSMEPEISSGDIVALQNLPDFRSLIYGDMYAIITASGQRTVKRVRRSDTPGCYRLVPTNPAYDWQDIPLEEIIKVYRVMGGIRIF